MDQILKTIGDTLAGFIDTPIVQLGFKAIAVYAVIVWLAVSYWAFRDMQGRTGNPILPYLAASFIILFTPVFFVFGVLLYRLMRPQERIGEATERGLAEEALLNEVESVQHCPGCARRIHGDWLICPTCRTRLNRVCPNCTRLVGLDWSLCAWCGKDFERREVATAPAPARVAPASVPVLSSPPPVVASGPLTGTPTIAVRTAEPERTTTGDGASPRPATPRSTAPRSTAPRAPAARPTQRRAPDPLTER